MEPWLFVGVCEEHEHILNTDMIKVYTPYTTKCVVKGCISVATVCGYVPVVIK